MPLAPLAHYSRGVMKKTAYRQPKVKICIRNDELCNAAGGRP